MTRKTAALATIASYSNDGTASVSFECRTFIMSERTKAYTHTHAKNNRAKYKFLRTNVYLWLEANYISFPIEWQCIVNVFGTNVEMLVYRMCMCALTISFNLIDDDFCESNKIKL